jgi:hypothetical protein
VYEAITGEAAPDVIVPRVVDVLDQPMNFVTQPANPLDQEMEEVPADDDDNLLDAQDDLLMPADEAQIIVTSTTLPDILPTLPPDDVASEFYIEHGSQTVTTNDDGAAPCRKEDMGLPANMKRKNRFHDNGRAFSDEKVTNHPDKAELGVQSIRPRGLVRGDDDMGTDTGSTIEVLCRLCGKTETVSAQLALGSNTDPDHNTYKCNACNTPNGRAKVMRATRNAQLNDNAPRRGKDTNTRGRE